MSTAVEHTCPKPANPTHFGVWECPVCGWCWMPRIEWDRIHKVTHVGHSAAECGIRFAKDGGGVSRNKVDPMTWPDPGLTESGKP